MFGVVRAPRVYEHIVAQIERAIYEGRLAHGDKLPPERQLVRGLGARLRDTRGVADVTHRRLRASEAVVDLTLPLAEVFVDPAAGRDAARGRQGNEHERHAPCHDSSHCESSCPGVDVSNGPWIHANGATPEPDRKMRDFGARGVACAPLRVSPASRH